MGPLLADHADRSERGHNRSGPRSRQKSLRRDDDHGKDRHRRDRSRQTWLRFMPDVNTTRRSYVHFVYGLVSVACPFISLGLMTIYQEYAYEWYWQIGNKPGPLDDADINAGAMM